MSNFDRNILITNINKLIAREKVTQAQLGAIAEMSQPNVCKALNPNDKKSFTVDQLIRISKHFKVSLDYLTGNTAVHSSISPRQIAEFFIELISHGDAEFGDVTVKEHVFKYEQALPDEYPEINHYEKTHKYPAIYLPSYWQISKYASPDEAEDAWHQMSQVGNETRMLSVNKFLYHYREILDIYRKGDLSEDTFNTVVDDMLNRLDE